MSQSRIPISQAMADDTITRYLNDYRCPACHKEIVPLHSEDIAL
jgi:hypothetical protein